MKLASPKGSTPSRILLACCPEAQADGVPCTSLGRNCEDCARAVSEVAEVPQKVEEERDDAWAV